MPALDPNTASPTHAVLAHTPPGGFNTELLSSAALSVSPVDTMRPELIAALPTYAEIRDCVAGEKTVKSRGAVYLPMPTDADAARYSAYVMRAVFYGVTRRTLLGLVGMTATKPAEIVVPPMMAPIVKDATGSGVTLNSLALTLVSEVCQVGRAGLLTDYPKTEGKPTTRKEQTEGAIRPTISAYAAEDIINWRVSRKNGRIFLSLVVLAETYDKDDDGFTITRLPQRRVLRIENGVYSVEIHRKVNDNASWTVEPKEYPTDAKGLNLTEIPFVFVGSVNNDPTIDPAPLADMASLNLAHYRNSADYEEGVYITGQPTPVITGLDEAWWTNVLKSRIAFGSRSGIPLPADATFELVQADPNNAALEAMKAKEDQMKAIGAKLVQVSSVQRTATETASDDVTEMSVLGQIVTNVNAAVLWSLEWAAIFSGATTVNRDAQDAENKTINFALSLDFDSPTIDKEEASASVTYWKDGALTFTEMREVLRGAKFATLSDDEAKEAIDSEKLSNMETFGLNADGTTKEDTTAEDKAEEEDPADDDKEI